MSRADIEGPSVFYGDWYSADITRERQLIICAVEKNGVPHFDR